MIFQPRRAQQLAIGFGLEHNRTNLWMSMGIGKTTSALTINEVRRAVDGDHRTLVLGPKRVIRDVWPSEVKKWDHLRHLDVSAIDGTAAERRQAMLSPSPIHAVSYDNLSWLLEELRGAWPYQSVIADESSRCKAHDSVRFAGVPERVRVFDTEEELQAAYAKAKHPSRIPKTRDGRFELITLPRRGLKDILSRTRYWMNLTGTPAPNGLQDLWAQAYLLDRGSRLGNNVTAFRTRWFRKKDSGFGFEPFGHSEREIMALLSDVSLTLHAKDFMDLPPLVENVISVKLPPRAMELHAQMKRDLVMELRSGTLAAAGGADKTNKLRQLANGAVYINPAKDWEEVHTAKLEAVESVIEESSGEPVIVTYQFQSDLARLQRAFPDARMLKTKSDENDWNAGKIPVMLLHPASAGHGLNLQFGGRTMVDFSLTWNLEEDQQVIERIGPTRQAQAGLNRTVFRHRIVAENTLDNYILKVMQGKATTQEAIMEYANHD